MEGPGPRSSQDRSWSSPVHRSYAVLRTGPLSTIPICSPPSYSILFYYSVLLRPLLLHPCPYYVSVLSVLSFQPSTLGSDPSSVSSDLAFILFLLLFGYNPYQPNPIAPRSLIVFCLLLSYDPFHPYCSDMYKLQQALVV